MYTLLLLFSAVSGLSGCSNNDHCLGIDCLPQATHTGAGTFGCLVNGESFYAIGGVTCYYQIIDGKYYFAFGFARETGFPRTASIESNENEIQMDINQLTESGQGKIYDKVIFDTKELF